jgi:ABC-type branched-subunit amino acid transport system ATPase component
VSDALLHAKKVSIRFGGLKALSEFDLEIRKGDLQGVVTLCEHKAAGQHPLFKALRAVAYDRSGMREEALALTVEAMRPPAGQACASHPGVLAAVAKVWRRGADG